MNSANQTSEIVKVKFYAIAHGGACIGDIVEDSTRNGKKMFAPFGVPGETCEVEIVKDNKTYYEGKIVKIIDSSPDRISPPCPYFENAVAVIYSR